MNMERRGKLLKELRRERALTQEQLAEHLGVSSRTVSRWETGSNLPDLSVLIELADLYGVELQELIDGERKSEDEEQAAKQALVKAADYADQEKQHRQRKLLHLAIAVLLCLCLVSLCANALQFQAAHQESVLALMGSYGENRSDFNGKNPYLVFDDEGNFCQYTQTDGLLDEGTYTQDTPTQYTLSGTSGHAARIILVEDGLYYTANHSKHIAVFYPRFSHTPMFIGSWTETWPGWHTDQQAQETHAGMQAATDTVEKAKAWTDTLFQERMDGQDYEITRTNAGFLTQDPPVFMVGYVYIVGDTESVYGYQLHLNEDETFTVVEEGETAAALIME